MSLREWSAKKFAAKVHRLLGLTSRSPARASASQRGANRSRLTVEGLEDRTVPALIEFDYTLNGALRHGYIGYNDGDINPALASQTVAVTDLYLSDGVSSFTETSVAGGGVKLSYGAYSGTDFWVNAGGSLHFYGSTTSFDIGWTPSSLIYDDVAITILDPKVTVTATADATEGGSNGTFHFTRTGDPSQPLTVNYTVGGTATSGTDYTALSGTVTFAAYSSTANVTVTAATDAIYDPDETVTVTIASGTGYTSGSPSFAEMSIADDIDTVETLIHQETFQLTGVDGNVNVTLTVTYNAPGASGLYTWSYQVTNPSGNAVDLTNFSIPIDDMDSDIANLASSIGWTGTIGVDSVSWTAGTGLAPGGTATFTFTTLPREIGGADVEATGGGGFLADKPNAPAPKPKLAVGPPWARLNFTNAATNPIQQYKLTIEITTADGQTYTTGEITILDANAHNARESVLAILKAGNWAVEASGTESIRITGMKTTDGKIIGIKSAKITATGGVGAGNYPNIIGDNGLPVEGP